MEAIRTQEVKKLEENNVIALVSVLRIDLVWTTCP